MTDKSKRRSVPIAFILLVAGINALGIYIILTEERITPAGGGVVAEDAGVPVVASREVRFVALENRALEVYDADTGELIDTVVLGRNKFFDSVIDMYSLDRKKLGVSIEAPYRVTEAADGRVSFEDPKTGNRIHEVKAFGSKNVKPFRQLLYGPPPDN